MGVGVGAGVARGENPRLWVSLSLDKLWGLLTQAPNLVFLVLAVNSGQGP